MKYSNKSLIELKTGLITFMELVASEWHYAQSIEMYGRKKKKSLLVEYSIVHLERRMWNQIKTLRALVT